MILEARPMFARAPRAANQAGNAVSHHGQGVIDGKQVNKDSQSILDCRARLIFSFSQASLISFAHSLSRFGQPTPRAHWSSLRVNNKIAMFFDQDRHRYRANGAMGLKGLQLIHLEGSIQLPSVFLENNGVEFAANISHSPMQTLHGVSTAI